jgi:hypothetical protein
MQPRILVTGANGFTGGAHHARTMMERIVAEIDKDLAEAEPANLGG